MQIRVLLCLFLTFCAVVSCIAQTGITVTGIVADEQTGRPLLGATVANLASEVEVLSDLDGVYRLEAQDGDELRVSYPGYESQTVLTDGRAEYNVLLRLEVEDDVVEVGTRGQVRTEIDRPVPIDVIPQRELALTGQTDLGQQVQFTSPTFNSAKYAINGTTNYADPATLRGMQPDQTLVLINGKRRHQFSALNLNVAPGLGTVITDLNAIPTAALRRVEVLRDGAAAQYGSDAIAGAINLVLEDQVNRGTFRSTIGQYGEGDGETFKNSLNYGLPVGKPGGFFNFTLEHFTFAGTDRSDTYTGALYPAVPDFYEATGPTPDFPYLTNNPRRDRGVYPDDEFRVGVYGSNPNDTYQAFGNFRLPFNDQWSFYSFGGYSKKNIVAEGFFRSPSNRAQGTLEIFPDGFTPSLPGSAIDYSGVAGISRKLPGSWEFDVSYSYGHNELELFNLGSVNPALGILSPTDFEVGQFNFSQQIIDAGVQRNFGSTNTFDNVNLAFGVQYRTDDFEVDRGSEASYARTLVDTIPPVNGKAVGSSGRPGIGIDDENELDRSNFAAYLDTELDITDRFLVAPALRFEDYSDFGAALSGRLALRYSLTDRVAVRGSYNRGFRAPSLAQIGNKVNTTTVQNNEFSVTKQVASDEPGLEELGVDEPTAELSNNYNLGFTSQFADGNLILTLDAYQIDIDDRIVISERIRARDYPAVARAFPGTAEIRFFTNAISTQTRGLDLVAKYRVNLENEHRLNLSAALGLNQTEVVGRAETPEGILAGADDQFRDLQLFGQTAEELFEVAQPRQKLILLADYQLRKVGFTARVTHFGNVKASSAGLSGVDDNVTCPEDGPCVQTFAAKTVTDLSVNASLSRNLILTLGSNNVFDVYPDKYNNFRDGSIGEAGSYANGQVPYSRNSNQFGFSGAYYFLMATLEF